MKKLLLLLILSFGFVLSAQADSISKVSKWHDCQDKLEKQKITNRDKLCSDKYGKEISSSFYDISDTTMRYYGSGIGVTSSQFALKVDNISSDLLITKIVMSVTITCKDKNICNKETNKINIYQNIEPSSKKKIDHYSSVYFFKNNPNWPDYKNYSWSYSKKAYGFKIDY